MSCFQFDLHIKHRMIKESYVLLAPSDGLSSLALKQDGLVRFAKSWRSDRVPERYLLQRRAEGVGLSNA